MRWCWRRTRHLRLRRKVKTRRASKQRARIRRNPVTSTPTRTRSTLPRNLMKAVRMRLAKKRRRKTQKPKPVKVDLDHLQDRAVALPLPPRDYSDLAAGKEGTLYLLESSGRFQQDRGATLTRFELKTKKSEKLADRVADFDLCFDGNKILLQIVRGESEGASGGAEPAPEFVIVS